MNQPIKAGDLCEVINGLGRGKSPNLGLHVTVVAQQGEHTRHGRIVRCAHPDLVQYAENGDYMKLGWADFPVTWLRKINDPELPKATSARKGEMV